MCSPEYTYRQEKFYFDLIRTIVEDHGDSDGSCFVGRVIETAVTENLIDTLIPTVCAFRAKRLGREPGEVEGAVRKEIALLVVEQMDEDSPIRRAFLSELN